MASVRADVNSIGNFLIWSELNAVTRESELLPGKNQPTESMNLYYDIPTILQCLHIYTCLFTKVIHF